MTRSTNEPPPLRDAPRCGARTRTGSPCQRPASHGKSRCRLHGGAPGSGAPRGERNGAYKHGSFTTEAVGERKTMRILLKALKP
jgi:hypothetical protein